MLAKQPTAPNLSAMYQKTCISYATRKKHQGSYKYYEKTGEGFITVVGASTNNFIIFDFVSFATVCANSIFFCFQPHIKR